LPFIVISPWAKVNYVDHAIIDHASVVRFIEDNCGLDRIGDQSFDAIAGSILNMFDFRGDAGRAPKLYLDPSHLQQVGLCKAWHPVIRALA
jgi:phospholipase C